MTRSVFLADYRARSRTPEGGPQKPGHRVWLEQGTFFDDCPVHTVITERGGGLHLSLIQVEDWCQGQGAASAVMKKLLTLADKHGEAVSLYPEVPPSASGLSVAQLVRWYEGYGFEKQGWGLFASWVREPRRGRRAQDPSFERDLASANVFLMDWVCDGWGKLPAKIQRIADKVGALTAAEKRALVEWFRDTAPGNYS